jgi:hypothetical protein
MHIFDNSDCWFESLFVMAHLWRKFLYLWGKNFGHSCATRNDPKQDRQFYTHVIRYSRYADTNVADSLQIVISSVFSQWMEPFQYLNRKHSHSVDSCLVHCCLGPFVISEQSTVLSQLHQVVRSTASSMLYILLADSSWYQLFRFVCVQEHSLFRISLE